MARHGMISIGDERPESLVASSCDNLEGFYKDLSIMGGFLPLCITGAGKYSIDALLGIALAAKCVK